MDLMNTAQLLGNFGEFVGAIAVVATLLYLAIQIRHNTRATEAGTMQSVIENQSKKSCRGQVRYRDERYQGVNKACRLVRELLPGQS